MKFIIMLASFVRSFRKLPLKCCSGVEKRWCSSKPLGIQYFNQKVANGPSLSDFIEKESTNLKEQPIEATHVPYITSCSSENHGRKVFVEVHGCQMNVNDTEIVFAILEKEGFTISKNINEADVIFVMTCAIREGAEQKIWKRLEYFKFLKKKRRSKEIPLKIGILGCMAERLKHKFLELEKMVDIVAGPDSYKDLPNLLSLAAEGQKAVNVMLSVDETYADIMPVRINAESKSAFVSIMRGCDNMCTYCIVPFTRGKERSRPLTSIVDEVKQLSDEGYKEVTLLGQNVNSYRDLSDPMYWPNKQRLKATIDLSKGFSTVYGSRSGGLRFADLLQEVAEVNAEMRIRFTSPHPKDFPDSVLQVIKEYPNVCKLIHLPAQSGNSEVLERMRRGYTVDAYVELVKHIKAFIPDIALTSDFICGFCGETEEAHRDTLSLMEMVKYEYAYIFPYSMRNKTAAYHTLKDDVPEEVKKRRAAEVYDAFRHHAHERHKKEIGKEHLVLASGPSKRSQDDWAGRNDWNTKVIFPFSRIPTHIGSSDLRHPQIGDYIVIKAESCSSQVLKGRPLYHTTLQEYHKKKTCDFSESAIMYSNIL